MKSIKIYANSYECNELANCLMIAAERFRENAAMFRKLIDRKPGPANVGEIMAIHGEAACKLAEQFDGQAEQASRFCQIFQAMSDESPLVIRYDEEMVEDDE